LTFNPDGRFTVLRELKDKRAETDMTTASGEQLMPNVADGTDSDRRGAGVDDTTGDPALIFPDLTCRGHTA
jgi:hypothetical protein